eukprot:Unigene16031_Nuclearia_a/m.47662 Unigene16031_Nuclearia_a/g.47662  ORF Unigene16031_Nuclearia_a/g.47662 Unigene16031_Nuclearia_a/m.47662 type:complete len:112 (-) Unigene16031_Nuclearia_a:40-375(-)
MTAARRPSSASRDPETAQLLAQRSALQAQVHALRETIRREKLSERYSDPAEVAKLAALVVKWRGATQRAAVALLRKAQEQAGEGLRLGHVLDGLQLDKRLLRYNADADEFS